MTYFEFMEARTRPAPTGRVFTSIPIHVNGSSLFDPPAKCDELVDMIRMAIENHQKGRRYDGDCSFG